MMVKNDKQIFQEFHVPIRIQSQTGGIIVLLKKSCPFKPVDHKAVTSNCLAVQKSAYNQELEIVR